MQTEDHRHHRCQFRMHVGLVCCSSLLSILALVASRVCNRCDHAWTYSCHQSHRNLFPCSLYRCQVDNPSELLHEGLRVPWLVLAWKKLPVSRFLWSWWRVTQVCLRKMWLLYGRLISHKAYFPHFLKVISCMYEECKDVAAERCDFLSQVSIWSFRLSGLSQSF